MRRALLWLALCLLPALAFAQAIQPLPFRDRAEEVRFQKLSSELRCPMWCVEGVWNGALEIVQYELLDQEAERYHFRPVGSIQAGPGSAGSLIPPHEYHTIRNPSEDAVAVSLHIYSGRMLDGI